MVDENGVAIILKSNTSKYIILEYDELEAFQNYLDEKVNAVVKRVLEDNMEAFKELAK